LSDDEEISLDNLEDLLDSGFDDEEEGEEEGPSAEEILAKQEAERLAREANEKPPFWKRFFPFLIPVVNKINDGLYFIGGIEHGTKKGLRHFFTVFLVEKFKLSQSWIKVKFAQLKGKIPRIDFKKYVDMVKSIEKAVVKKYLTIVAGVFAAIAILVSVINFFHREIFSDAFLPSMRSVADQVYEVDEFSVPEPLYNNPRFAAYGFTFDKFMVNLQMSKRSTRKPMVALEIHVEGTSNEVISEISSKKGEYLDLLQTEILGLTYEDMATGAGKLQVRDRLRDLLSSNIKSGEVSRLYYSMILLKP
jgi:flagellar basal body-associated protein FliL